MSDASAEERRRALRALLARPCLVAGRDDDALRLVRRHGEVLRAWLLRHTGWHLHVERGLARLYKRPGDPHAQGRGARDHRGEPFTRRRYVLLCLSLAALERAERQTTLGLLADEVVAIARGDEGLRDAGVSLSLERIQDRRDLAVVVRYLVDQHALVRVDGAEDDYVKGKGDVLYRVDANLLARLPQWRTPPSLLSPDGHATDFDALLDGLASEVHVESEETIRNARRHRLARRLLDDPVVYLDSLDADEAEYLTRVRGTVVRELARETGMVLEDRTEGIALSDPHAELTDVRLPEEGTEGHITLLVAELLSSVRVDEPAASLSLADVAAHIAAMRDSHGKYWHKAAREHGSEQALARAALDRLRQLSLVWQRPDGRYTPLPAVARYALVAPATTAPGHPEAARER